MILCSGCFDGLHAGHVAYLKAAAVLKRPGEVLLVSVAPDDYIKHVKLRGIRWTQAQRSEVVQAIRDVDEVYRDPNMSIATTISMYSPNYFVKGSEWRNKLPADVQSACKKVDCQIVYVEMVPVAHNSEHDPRRL